MRSGWYLVRLRPGQVIATYYPSEVSGFTAFKYITRVTLFRWAFLFYYVDGELYLVEEYRREWRTPNTVLPNVSR